MTLPETLISRIKAAHRDLEAAQAGRGLAEMSLSQATQKLDNVKCDLRLEDKLLGGWAINNKRTKAVSDQKETVSQAANDLKTSAQEIKEKEEAERKIIAEYLIVNDETYGDLKIALGTLTNFSLQLEELEKAVQEARPVIEQAVDTAQKKFKYQNLYSSFINRPEEPLYEIRSRAYKAFDLVTRNAESTSNTGMFYGAARKALSYKPLTLKFNEIATAQAPEIAADILMKAEGRSDLLEKMDAISLTDLAHKAVILDQLEEECHLAHSLLGLEQSQMQLKKVQKEQAVLKQALRL